MYNKKETVKVLLYDLQPHPKNPKKHKAEIIEKSLDELGYAENIVIDENNTILSGHGRVDALKKLKGAKGGGEEVEVIRISGWTEEEKEKYLLLANQSVILGGFDDVKLKEFQEDILLGSGFKLDEGEDSIYTTKISTPLYYPEGKNVQIAELYNKEKTESLLKEIQALEINNDIKDFLIHSAYRFTTFNFQNTAEFYSKVDNEDIKKIMEEMALVIIDFKKAIENGFVILEEELKDIMEVEEGYEK